MAILTEKPHEWESYQRNFPSGFTAIETKYALAHPEILKSAKQFIDKSVRANKPMGYSEKTVIDGRDILFTIEPHCHEVNGPIKPWGWHKGCSVAIGEVFPIGSDIGVEMTTKVKTGLTIGAPAIVGLFLLGPIGAALGAAGGAAWHHFKK